MRTLLLELPTTPAGPHAVYTHAWADTVTTARLQLNHSPLALLPRPERRTPVNVIVPAAMLSWQCVTLPAGLGRHRGRLQEALKGLLEDRLLQDADQVHIALPQQWTAGEPIWAAVCDKAWLLQHVQALQDADLPVQRLVPEFAPPLQGAVWHATGQNAHSGTGWLWCCSADKGITGWPTDAAAQWPQDAGETCPVLAEPGLSDWARSRYPERVQLVDNASHWAAALDSGWDLAQFELAARLRQRQWLRWRERLDVCLQHPDWRPARWGLLALLLAQLAGLNAWAWMTRHQWQRQQDVWVQMLQQSFPNVTVVLDAPVQMAREVARLRLGSGQLTPADFESQLQALGSALPADVASPGRLSYQDGALQWPALPISASHKVALEKALAAQGYSLETQGEQWRLRVRQTPEARP